MIEMHAAQGEELDQALAMWPVMVGDGPAHRRDPSRLVGLADPLVLTEDGQVRAMLAAPVVTLVFPDGWQVRAGYLYALATHPQFRGRGHAAQLMLYAEYLMRERGLDCALTVPDRPSLIRFFTHQGYQPGFYQRRVDARPGPVQAGRVSPEEYGALREELLTGRTHVRYDPSQLELQQALCTRPGSGLYRLALTHGPGCAAVENWQSGPVIKELLCSAQDEEEGLAGACSLCGCPAQACLPGLREGDEPFGLIRWLHAAPPSRWQLRPEGYLGLAFD